MNEDRHDDDRLDLSALAAGIDTVGPDARIAAIVRDAMAARAARAARTPRDGLVGALVRWSRPISLAAAIILALAIPTLALVRRTPPPPVPLPPTDALGIPRPLAVILHSNRDPSLAELHDAVLGSAP